MVKIMNIKNFVKYDLKTAVFVALDSSNKHINRSYVKTVMQKSHILVDDDIENHLNNQSTRMFFDTVSRHSEVVNYFGKLFGLKFESHDWTKLYDSIEAKYYYYFTLYRLSHNDISGSLLQYQSDAKKHHIENNKHHPEYWSKISLMPDKYIIEMVCDWQAMAIDPDQINNELGYTDAKKYYTEVALPKNNFTKKQQELILSSINHLNKNSNLNEILKIWQR